MGIFKRLVSNIKKKLFGQDERPTDFKPISSPRKTKAPPYEKTNSTSLDAGERSPYFVQIGFDFGTSYSKCICRDVMINKAWVHLPPKSQGQEFPFLIPNS